MFNAGALRLHEFVGIPIGYQADRWWFTAASVRRGNGSPACPSAEHALQAGTGADRTWGVLTGTEIRDDPVRFCPPLSRGGRTRRAAACGLEDFVQRALDFLQVGEKHR